VAGELLERREERATSPPRQPSVVEPEAAFKKLKARLRKYCIAFCSLGL
jgi:hypothetical protein